MNLGWINSKAFVEYIKILKLHSFIYKYQEKKIEVAWKTEKYKILKV